ncbi:hypothetical protein GW17_00013314 [Ensete ventricosum]|nr:hypothetical protein GW17_00013314 [Ensete ventricosum]
MAFQRRRRQERRVVSAVPAAAAISGAALLIIAVLAFHSLLAPSLLLNGAAPDTAGPARHRRSKPSSILVRSKKALVLTGFSSSFLSFDMIHWFVAQEPRGPTEECRRRRRCFSCAGALLLFFSGSGSPVTDLWGSKLSKDYYGCSNASSGFASRYCSFVYLNHCYGNIIALIYYIWVRQVAGTRTARYRVVPSKIDRRQPIEGEIDRRRSIEGEKGKKKKRKRKKKEKKKT